MEARGDANIVNVHPLSTGPQPIDQLSTAGWTKFSITGRKVTKMRLSAAMGLMPQVAHAGSTNENDPAGHWIGIC